MAWKSLAASIRPAEFLLACATLIASFFAVMLVTQGVFGDEIFGGLLLGLLAFVIARGITGRISVWDELRPAQWIVLPTLAAGYLALLFILLIWPAVIMLFHFGAAPLIMDVDPAWSFFGEDFVDPSRNQQNPRYWVMVSCAALTASTIWWIAVSLLAKLLPRTFCSVFHPSSSAQIRTVATYVILLAVFALAPSAALLWSLVALR